MRVSPEYLMHPYNHDSKTRTVSGNTEVDLSCALQSNPLVFGYSFSFFVYFLFYKFFTKVHLCRF